jgi:site-specific DNA recombinase
VVNRYDDGAFSGGNLARPALQRLLTDIRAGRIDIVIVYKGGDPPLGYDASERSLVINLAEAKTVRHLFALYLQLGCLHRVKDETDRLGLKTKRSAAINGVERGGKPFSRGHIYRLLSNPIYTGRIAHKGQLYPGQHPALIEHATWTAVRSET